MSQQQQWPRGPANDLHVAAYHGSMERTMALLSEGSIDIDQGNPQGFTPLMVAATQGHSRIARFLLKRGANVTIVMDLDFTALHNSAHCGHLAVTTDLLKAGADLEARTSEGATPLYLAAIRGHSKVLVALIKAGAIVDSRTGDGTTPLYAAAVGGHLNAVKELLGGGANPILGRKLSELVFLPLDAAALCGHPRVVCELIKQGGIEGCAGERGGVTALGLAAKHQQVDTMAILTESGVVDSGIALGLAAGWGGEAAVKLLLKQRQLEGPPTSVVEYVNFHDQFGATALLRSIQYFADDEGRPPLISAKVVRLLIDAGADTSSAVHFSTTRAGVQFNDTPLAFTNSCLRKTQVKGEEDVTEEQLYRLEAVRRLLVRVEAVHALSWLWHTDAAFAQPPTGYDARKVKTASAPLREMMPILRRRARRHRLVLAPLFRLSEKMGHEPACDGEDKGFFAAVWCRLWGSSVWRSRPMI